MKFNSDRYGSFGGLNYETLELKDVDLIIQGIPYEGATSGKKGTSLAPGALRFISKDMQTISRRGVNFQDLLVRDMGDVPIYPMSANKTRKSIENHFQYLTNNSFAPIISFGGDHSISYPIIKTLANIGSVGIIWFDAHRDLLDNYLGSKYSHGSPLRRCIELDNVKNEDILIIGARYLDFEEQTFLENTQIHELTMVEIENNANALKDFKQIVFDINNKVDNLYVSIDIDVLDPAFAPGTGTPVAGGLATSQLMNFIWELPSKIRAFDIVETSPPLDNSGITLKAVMGILSEILAKLFINMKN